MGQKILDVTLTKVSSPVLHCQEHRLHDVHVRQPMHPPALAIAVQHANQSRVNSRDENEDAVQALYRARLRSGTCSIKGSHPGCACSFLNRGCRGYKLELAWPSTALASQ